MIELTREQAERIQRTVMNSTFFLGYDDKEYLLAGGQIFSINKKPKKKDAD